MNNHNNFSITINLFKYQQPISKQSSLKYLGITVYSMKYLLGSLRLKRWWHNSANHVKCCLNWNTTTFQCSVCSIRSFPLLF